MHVFLHIISFLFAICALVLVHEYGHFLVARWCKVKVERFSIGFGKPLVKWKSKRYETEYVFAPILLGGYVKLLDTREQTVARKDQNAAFDNRPLLQRLAIIAAGPIANIIFALMAFWLMFVIGIKVPKPIIGKVIPNSIASTAGMKAGEEIIQVDQRATDNWQETLVALLARAGDGGEVAVITQQPSLTNIKRYQLNVDHLQMNSYTPNPLEDIGWVRYTPPAPPIVAKVMQKSPAERAGLLIGDRILRIDNTKVYTWDEFLDQVRARPNKSVKLIVDRQHKLYKTQATIASVFGPGWKKTGFLGVSPILVPWPEQAVRFEQFSPLLALPVALHQVQLFSELNVIILKKLAQGRISFHVLGGPISIFSATAQAVDQGAIVFCGFLAIISLTIALLNLLPLPGLDGGHLLLLIIEGITRRPIPVRTQVLILRLGLILLTLLVIQTTVNDLMRIFK